MYGNAFRVVFRIPLKSSIAPANQDVSIGDEDWITAVCKNNVNSQIFASGVVRCAQIGSVVNESARSVGNELMVISAALLSTSDGPSDGETTRKVLQNVFYNNPTPLCLRHCRRSR